MTEEKQRTPRRLWQRLKYLLQEPTYRTKLAFFFLLGVLVLIWSQRSTAGYQPILAEFAAAFLAIGILQLLWDFLGGEPLELQLSDFEENTTDRLGRIESANRLLHDLSRYYVGLERIWPNRLEFAADTSGGLLFFRNKVLTSKKVFMQGITLWNNWFGDGDFQEALIRAVKGGTRIRILLYEPGSVVQRTREEDERDPGGQMIHEIRGTVRAVLDISEQIPEAIRDHLEIKFTYQANHPAQVICGDESMMVAFYLAGVDGFQSPTMFVKGTETRFYKVFVTQFERLWRRAKDIEDCEALADLIKDD